MATQEYEHRVSVDAAGHKAQDVIPASPRSAHQAGELAKKLRGFARHQGGGTVTIERRPVGEWETVERTEVPKS